MRSPVGMVERWRVVVPAVAVVALAATWGSKPGSAVLALVAVLLAGSVLAAVEGAIHLVLLAAFLVLAIRP